MKKNQKKNMNKYISNKLNIPTYIIFLITLIYLEFIFRIFCTEKLLTPNFIYTILFIIPFSLILTIFSSLTKNKINSIITKIIIFIITVWFTACSIFKLKMGVFFSINGLGLANQLTSFINDTLKTIFNNFYIIILLFIPFILLLIFNKKINYTKINKKTTLKFIIALIISICVFHISLLINKNKDYSIYKLYNNINNHSLTIEKVGINISTYIELKRKIFGFKETSDNFIYTENIPVIEEIEETKYNIVKIDFDSINETNNTLKLMNEYFKNDPGTKQNKYTGLYKGKNLILFMAESFNSFIIDKKLTPTLYKLTNESFVFENFYSPVILSTIGGEFQELTGLYPNIGLLSSVWRKGKNYFPYGIGNVFNNLNYSTYAYHNNQYNFQNRDKYLKSIGFNNYIGCYNGLEERINCNIWPESDVEMIEATVEDYINNENPFMTYYVTVSGHMAYNWGNEMSKKHKEAVKNLPYSEEIKAYIATQIELDKALETLIQKLTEAGKLDDTVIALVGDHYPYDLTLNQINEVSKYERDSIIEINHSSFILWNNKTKKTTITKVGSQIDVLPTLLNIFGIEYDSRLIIGKDILSDTEGLAIFSNNSWVSDKGKYFSSTNKFIPNEGMEIDEEYISNINKIVNQKITMSQNIIKFNYYDYIFNTKTSE